MSIEKIKIIERLLKNEHISLSEAVVLINTPLCGYKLSSDFEYKKKYNPENIQAFQ